MGLPMNERKAVTRETSGEYHKAGKKEKGLILDQYVRLTGYNRKYALRVLSTSPAKTETEKPTGQTALHRGNRCPHRNHPAVLLVYVWNLSGGTHQTK
jgi:hypothetical protein